MRSKIGDTIARNAVSRLRETDEYKLWHKICYSPPRNPELLAREFDIEVVYYPGFSRPGAEALKYFNNDGWKLFLRLQDSEKTQRFAAAHGIVHYILHRHMPQLLSNGRMDWRAETQANAGAGLMLIEEEIFGLLAHANGISPYSICRQSDWQKPHITHFLQATQEVFGVNKDVVFWSLFDLGYARRSSLESAAVPEDDLLPF